MMKKILTATALFTAMICNLAFSEDIAARRIFIVRGGENSRCVEYDTQTGELWLGTSSALYRSPDLGFTWEREELPPGGLSVTGITFDRGYVVISTQHGLYAETGDKKTWARISLKRRLSGAVRAGEDTVVSWDQTTLDLFDIADRTLKREIGGEIFHDRIAGAVSSGGYVYVVTDGAVFNSGDGMGTWESFILGKRPAEEAVQEAADANTAALSEADEGLSAVRSINADGGVIVCGRDGLYEFTDGKNTAKISLAGIRTGRIKNAVKISGGVYAATDKEVLKLDAQSALWKTIFTAGGDDSIVSLRVFPVESGKYFIVLLTMKGVYILSEEKIRDIRKMVPECPEKDQVMPALLVGPDLIAVHKAAVKYSDVQPEKIVKWKQQARMKSLMPKVDVDVSRSTGENVEIYTSATTAYSVCGPKDTSNGWSLGLSWNLADLIWSTDQTSIDTRSKLNTELRNEILQDVTRVYFERKKLIGEIASGRVRARDIQDKLLRVEELTAYIDAYTGGWFSQELGRAGNN